MHAANNVYYNARSLLPKFDELLISVDTHNPDIICITESCLCTGILDSEILIPGYQSLRHDRNRHGGGILMYVSHRFVVRQVSPHPSLELLTVVLHCGNCRICFIGHPVHHLRFCIYFTVILNQLTFLSFLVLYLLVISILIFLIKCTLYFLIYVNVWFNTGCK